MPTQTRLVLRAMRRHALQYASLAAMVAVAIAFATTLDSMAHAVWMQPPALLEFLHWCVNVVVVFTGVGAALIISQVGEMRARDIAMQLVLGQPVRRLIAEESLRATVIAASLAPVAYFVARLLLARIASPTWVGLNMPFLLIATLLASLIICAWSVLDGIRRSSSPGRNWTDAPAGSLSTWLGFIVPLIVCAAASLLMRGYMQIAAAGPVARGCASLFL